ncbi:unnamed protein product [Pleuronectes platessa]|uniref:Uncharacterized protein n=1 Tax=Pleuronectes platessa TaxID=8262 RepID=A0A9N7UJD0_PLEPL|nr:unnamed protein product [Pleuronectes platessa]
MVLSRQTGTDKKLGTSSLRQHAMPSPFHPPLARSSSPLTTFSSRISNLAVPAPRYPPDFLPSLPSHFCLSIAQPLPLLLLLLTSLTSFLLIQKKGLAVCSPHHKATTKVALPLLPEGGGGATEPCPPITLGARGGHHLATVLRKSSMGMPGRVCAQLMGAAGAPAEVLWT